ncbi:hypothetical protein KFK09_000502 [Dendrobium nobile]|uniref:Uncharacterized protein n=1 Tax=Dendrobium nobile TaxID=94219 RepID=A0A8T3CEX0_DENNO|nr:hypothetical protein KFK09_000502 [Dendrobium nobile]
MVDAIETSIVQRHGVKRGRAEGSTVRGFSTTRFLSCHFAPLSLLFMRILAYPFKSSVSTENFDSLPASPPHRGRNRDSIFRNSSYPDLRSMA